MTEPRSQPAATSARIRQFLSFAVDGRPYCVGIADVREIRQWMRATPLPNQPPHVLGVLNLRGSIVPVQDLRILLGAPAPDPVDTNVIVIVQVGTRRAGLLVDSVSDILSLAEEEIQPVPIGRTRDGSEALLEALATQGEQMVGILDLARVLEAEMPEAADA